MTEPQVCAMASNGSQQIVRSMSRMDGVTDLWEGIA